MKRNDILWKAALEDLFDDFLLFFYPEADKLFDLDKGFVYLDKELDQLFPPEGNVYAPRYVDKLVKVFTLQGQEEWILVHVEVQGYIDQDFAERMFQYYYRILDKYRKPITAFAIFADTNKNFHPQFYERNFLGTRVYYSFNTYKIIDQSAAELEASNNPFAMAVLSAKTILLNQTKGDKQLFEQAFNLAKTLLTMQMPKEKIRKVMNFLRYYINFENTGILTKFDEEIAALTKSKSTMGIDEFIMYEAKYGREEGIERGIEEGIERGIEQGIEQGIEKGIEKNTRETAIKMIKNGLDLRLIADITGLSIEELKRLS